MDKWHIRKETAIWSWVTLLAGFVFLAQVVLAVSSGDKAAAENLPPVAKAGPRVIERMAAPVAADTASDVTELLVDAIIQIESSGNPRCVGSAGERGLMQIKSGTWKQTSKRVFGRPVAFDRAFEPAMNRRIGSAYLSDLQVFLMKHKDQWHGDERSMLLAAYNAGPNALRRAGFDVTRLSRHTQSYVERASALHDVFMASVDDGKQRLRLSLAERVRQDS